MAGIVSEREKVILKKFPPEQSGQRVGLISVESSTQNIGQAGPRLYTDIDIVVADVSEDGAQYGYTKVPGTDAEKFVMGDDISGFVAVSALQLQVWKGLTVEQAVEVNLQNLYAAEGGHDAKSIIDRGSKKEKTIWAEGSNEVLRTIKEQLAGENVERFYPFVYYMLNAAIGDRRTRDKLISSFGTMYTGEVTPLADDDMQETTQQLLDGSREVAKSFAEIIKADEKMKEDLGRFSSIPAGQLPENFTLSRKQVHEAEARAIAAGKELFIPQMSFLRTGLVRSWPYMDAAMPFEDERAFGIELDALENNNEKPAAREIEREVEETQHRLDYAQSSVGMLTTLLQAEQEQASL